MTGEQSAGLPSSVAIGGELNTVCKYGENGWQLPAGLYSSGTKDPLALDKFALVGGTPPSYNNWGDIDRLLQTITHIAAVARVNGDKVPLIALGVKHGNPCGAAIGWSSPIQPTNAMMNGDPLAIFGGLAMFNYPLDEDVADQLAGKMLDGIVAPAIEPGAIVKLRRKGDKCRFLVNPALAALDENSLDAVPRFRYVRGGFLRQPNYTFVPQFAKHATVCGDAQIAWELHRYSLYLAWAVGSTSNSNTITLVNKTMLIGNGVGQQDRVGAAELAIGRARCANHEIEGAVAYSDSFFPFTDAPRALIDAGVRLILTSSGSIRDVETIELCRQRNVGLLMIPDAVGRGFFGH